MRKSENPLLIASLMRNQQTPHDQPATFCAHKNSPFHLHQSGDTRVIHWKMLQKKKNCEKPIRGLSAPPFFTQEASALLPTPLICRTFCDEFNSHQQHRNQGRLKDFLYPCNFTMKTLVKLLQVRKHFFFLLRKKTFQTLQIPELVIYLNQKSMPVWFNFPC